MSWVEHPPRVYSRIGAGAGRGGKSGAGEVTEWAPAGAGVGSGAGSANGAVSDRRSTPRLRDRRRLSKDGYTKEAREGASSARVASSPGPEKTGARGVRARGDWPRETTGGSTTSNSTRATFSTRTRTRSCSGSGPPSKRRRTGGRRISDCDFGGDASGSGTPEEVGDARRPWGAWDALQPSGAPAWTGGRHRAGRRLQCLLGARGARRDRRAVPRPALQWTSASVPSERKTETTTNSLSQKE